MPTKPKEVTQHDMDYVSDTRDLILDILASNKIPEDISLAALSSALLYLLRKNSQTPSEFANKVASICDNIEKAALSIILQQAKKKD